MKSYLQIHQTIKIDKTKTNKHAHIQMHYALSSSAPESHAQLETTAW